jgi:hypothetical protein
MTFSSIVTDLHRDAERAAFSCYIRKGRVPPEIQEIVEATRSVEAFLLYKSANQPRVPAGSPCGGQWCGDHSTSSIKSRADAEEVVRTHKGTYVGQSIQCASLTKALATDIPAHTPDWKPGQKVEGNTDIPVGTPIATFNYKGEPGTNGYGPASSVGGVYGKSHTGIYLGQDKDGVQILHQYKAIGEPEIKTIPWKAWRGNADEAGSRYYVIQPLPKKKYNPIMPWVVLSCFVMGVHRCRF